MHLYRTHTDIQLIGNQLVGHAFNHQLHHVFFAVRQLIEATAHLFSPLQGGQMLGRQLKCLLHTIHQCVIRERLFAKIKGSALDRIHSGWHVRMAGQKDHGHGLHLAALEHAVEQRQAAHSRHAHIQQQAAGAARHRAALQHVQFKFFGVAVALAQQSA